MAIFRVGPIVGGISGVLGGAVFSNSKAGPIIRPRGVRSGAASSSLLVAQGAPGRIAAAWAALTAAQRAVWNTVALSRTFPNRLGVRRQLSGFQLYTQYAIDVYGGAPPAALAPPSVSNIYAPVVVATHFLEGGPWIMTSRGNPWPTSTPTEYGYIQSWRRSTQISGFTRGVKVGSWTHPLGSHDAYLEGSGLSLPLFTGFPYAAGVRWRVSSGYVGARVDGYGVVGSVPWTVDGFESGSLANYTYASTYYSVQSATKHSGTYALQCTFPAEAAGFKFCYSTTGLAPYPVRGCIVDTWVYWSTSLGSYRFMFGLQDATNFYAVRLGLFGAFSLRVSVAGVETVLGSTTGTALSNGAWHRLRVAWGYGGTITCTVYNASGTSLGSWSGTSTTYANGGYGWQIGNQAGVGFTIYLDDTTIEGRAA